MKVGAVSGAACVRLCGRWRSPRCRPRSCRAPLSWRAGELESWRAGELESRLRSWSAGASGLFTAAGAGRSRSRRVESRSCGCRRAVRRARRTTAVPSGDGPQGQEGRARTVRAAPGLSCAAASAAPLSDSSACAVPLRCAGWTSSTTWRRSRGTGAARRSSWCS